jgi:hypothetical protein
MGFGVEEGEGAGEAGAVGGAGDDFEGGVDEIGAVAHDAEADAGVGGWGWGEAGAVVVDEETEGAAGGVEGDVDARGVAVFDGVAEGFLGDAVEVGGDGGVIEGGGATGGEAAGDAEEGLAMFGELAEG